MGRLVLPLVRCAERGREEERRIRRGPARTQTLDEADPGQPPNSLRKTCSPGTHFGDTKRGDNAKDVRVAAGEDGLQRPLGAVADRE